MLTQDLPDSPFKVILEDLCCGRPCAIEEKNAEIFRCCWLCRIIFRCLVHIRLVLIHKGAFDRIRCWFSWWPLQASHLKTSVCLLLAIACPFFDPTLQLGFEPRSLWRIMRFTLSYYPLLLLWRSHRLLHPYSYSAGLQLQGWQNVGKLHRLHEAEDMRDHACPINPSTFICTNSTSRSNYCTFGTPEYDSKSLEHSH